MLVRRMGVLAVAVLLVAACCGEGACTVPHLINYQGVVTDAAGIVVNGTHTLTFGIYPEPEDMVAGALWTEAHTGVALEDGLFNVILGSVVTLPENLFSAGADRWLGVKVDGDAEMRPRMRITSVPWAYKAGLADSALAAPGGATGWTISGNNMYSTVAGNIGVGEPSPLAKLHVRSGDIQLPQTATYGEDAIVEAGDAVLGLYSTDGGSYGSAITLAELDAAHALTGKWSMFRTTGVSSRLTFSFGPDSSYAANPAIMSLRSTGVGIGTTGPARKLEISDTQAFVRLTSSSANGSVLELKSSATDAGTWRGKINFLNGSNTADGAIEYYALAFMDQPGMYFKAGGYTRLFLNSSNGNVGIGTATPAEKLQVEGTVKCSILKLTGGSDIAEPFDVNEPLGAMEGAVARYRSRLAGQPQGRRRRLRPACGGRRERRGRRAAGARYVAGRHRGGRRISRRAHGPRVLSRRRVERADRAGGPSYDIGNARARDEGHRSRAGAGRRSRQGDDLAQRGQGSRARPRQPAVGRRDNDNEKENVIARREDPAVSRSGMHRPFGDARPRAPRREGDAGDRGARRGGDLGADHDPGRASGRRDRENGAVRH